MREIQTLADACSHIVDCAHKTAPIDPHGSHWAVGTPAMRGNRIDYSEARRISAETFRAWTTRIQPEPGDLLLAREAPVGPVVRIPDPANVAPGQRTVLLRAKPDVVDGRFLYYFLASTRTQGMLHARAAGSTVAHLNVTDVRELPIAGMVPELGEQRAIAEVLGALDDKIAANDRVAALAVELAEANFQSACAESVHTGALGEVAELVLGGTPSRARSEYWTDGTVPWLASGKANEERVLAPTEWITEVALEKSAAKWMPVRATILAITGATLGQVARLEIAATGNQSLVGIWHNDRALNDWLYFAVRSSIGELVRHATGAAQQHVNKGDVERLRVPLLAPDVLESWAAYASPLLDLAASRDRESTVLATARDELLPLLMSGKVRVRDAEKRVEEVL